MAATGHTGSRAYYSNYGTSVEIAAPGGDAQLGKTILSTLNAGTTTPGADSYANYQGTSMATPHVVGVVSLMLSANPGLTPAQVTSMLQATATKFPAGDEQQAIARLHLGVAAVTGRKLLVPIDRRVGCQLFIAEIVPHQQLGIAGHQLASVFRKVARAGSNRCPCACNFSCGNDGMEVLYPARTSSTEGEDRGWIEIGIAPMDHDL